MAGFGVCTIRAAVGVVVVGATGRTRVRAAISFGGLPCDSEGTGGAGRATRGSAGFATGSIGIVSIGPLARLDRD